jgi:ferredoxin
MFRHYIYFYLLIFIFLSSCQKKIDFSQPDDFAKFQDVANKYRFTINEKFYGQLKSKFKTPLLWDSIISAKKKIKKIRLRKEVNYLIVPSDGYFYVTVKDDYGFFNRVIVNGDYPLKDQLEEHGISLQSCDGVGASASCVAKLISGSIDQFEQSFLTDYQILSGYFLPCVTYPLSDIEILIGQEDKLVGTPCNLCGNGIGDVGPGGGLIIPPISPSGTTLPVFDPNNPYLDLNNIINVADDQIINNGVFVNDYTDPSSTPKLIAKTAPRNNTEDMLHGFNGDVSGILPTFLINKTEGELFNWMEDLFDICTTFDNELKSTGNKMINRFKENKGGVYFDEVLNAKVKSSSGLINFVKKFGEQLNIELKKVDGDIDNVSIINLQNTRPIFNGLYNKFHACKY